MVRSHVLYPTELTAHNIGHRVAQQGLKEKSGKAKLGSVPRTLLGAGLGGISALVQSEPLLWSIPIFAYLLGSFPTGVVFSRIRFGIDVREMGSGNIGATNITRNFGWMAGAFVLVIDFLKAWVPLKLLLHYAPEQTWVICMTGFAVVLGHCFSVFLKFSGGKGVASSLGCLAALMPFTALIAALTYVVGLSVTRISAVGSLMGVLVAIGHASFYEASLAYKTMVWLVSAVVLLRHRTNLSRMVVDLSTPRAAKK